MDEWVWMVRKRLESYLKIYDTRQQEAWLRWLLLKEFGHHVTYPLSKGMWVEAVWKDTCIIGQQEVWMHYDDMKFFISIIIFSSHDLYDEGMGKKQKLLLLGLLLGEHGKIFSHTLHGVAGVGYGTIMVQRGYSLALDDQELLPPWK